MRSFSSGTGETVRVGIVGTGKMGGEIEAMAVRRGHRLAWKLSSRENREGEGLTGALIGEADIVFEFTNPGSAAGNLLRLGRAGARVVCGTTGWSARLPEVTEAFREGAGALVWAANFSVGVRQFFEVAREAARRLAPAGYAAWLVEEHHASKRDAPSGTARTIAAIVEEEGVRPLPIASVRAGTVPGLHRLVFESPEDEIELIHRARSRAGFARGAVWAAERLAGRTGVFEFGELLKEVS
jgi:4-hydroxy-tetrahydrodipicolinate reductase